MLRFPNTLGVIFGAGMNIVSLGSSGVQRDSALLGAVVVAHACKSLRDKACPLLRLVLMDGDFWCGDARRARFCGWRFSGCSRLAASLLKNALRYSLHRAAGVCP